MDPVIPTATDWKKVTVGFNSWGYEEVEISPRAVGGSAGTMWIDDLEIEEVGLVNLLRRPGTPIAVRGEEGGFEYEEGRDFARLEDPELDFGWEHDPPPVTIPPRQPYSRGRTAAGELLSRDFGEPEGRYPSA